ncbi:MAG: DNA primase [Polyangia bacterium]
MIPDAKIAEIRERADIVEVIGEHVALKRAGSNMKGVCPFHADTDPSFNVSPDRQFFYCFGCGASGDVFTFLQRLEGLEFLEAAERLAERYGVELPRERGTPASRSARDRKREHLRRRHGILELAAGFFEEKLAAPEGAPARELLKGRGVEMETAARFRLGYAPDSWQALLDHLGRNRVSAREAERVGLALPRKSGSGYYDRFRNRLVFTITDPAGHPIAFSARAIEDDEKAGAKYVNSPETDDYKKGDVLYGLHQARIALSKTRQAILVEGNFDVVSLSRLGFENVVAPLGTALTERQAAVLRRRADEIVIVFDGDAAGRKAAARAFPILARAGLAVYVAPLPPEEDPDSLARRGGAAAVEELLRDRRGLLDEIIDASAARSDGTAQDAARRIARLKPLLEAVRDSMERDVYRQRIAEAFRVDPRTVFRHLRGAAAVETPAGRRSRSGDLPGRSEERELVGLLLDRPELAEPAASSGMVPMITTRSLRRIAEELVLRRRRKDSLLADLVAELDDEPASRWLAERALQVLYEDGAVARRALDEIGGRLSRHHLSRKIKDIDVEIREAHSAKQEDRALDLMRQKAEIQKELHGVAGETR